MILVSCSSDYWEFVRLLRNHPEVSSGFIQSQHITKEGQSKYMQEHSQFYKICLLEDVPCGYVGVIANDIRICTHPDYQRRGVGLFMLKEIVNYYPKAIGKVKLQNFKSRDLFVAAGFSQVGIIGNFVSYSYQK
ncbi:GNAT family N-acetyltransferase [Gammaproteobacteria bacterium]|nr:GNAT family N-acetyltransferase [Gammaproteobacteria bacterium]